MLIKNQRLSMLMIPDFFSLIRKPLKQKFVCSIVIKMENLAQKHNDTALCLVINSNFCSIHCKHSEDLFWINLKKATLPFWKTLIAIMEENFFLEIFFQPLSLVILEFGYAVTSANIFLSRTHCPLISSQRK